MKQTILELFGRLKGYPGFIQDFRTYQKLAGSTPRFPITWSNTNPQLFDKTSDTPFDHHYIYHPAWAARIVKEIAPKVHIDISSTLTFSSMLSAFVPVEFYDYRPADLKLSNLESKAGNLLTLPFADNSIHSLSCMHTIEHVGLGRYGDPIDPDADIKAINELKRVTAVGGNVLFVTPVGKPTLIFNAHRIYSYEQILKYFTPFKLKEFSLIQSPSSGSLIKNASPAEADACTYGCGCFWFQKNEQ